MHRILSKLAIIGAAFAVLIGLTVLITGQPASKLTKQPASKHHVGLVEDWSFHHLVFSNPGTYEQVAKDPAAYAKWLTIRYDTRFIIQQTKRATEAANSPAPQVTAIAKKSKPGPPPPPPPPPSMKRDWFVSLGTGGGVADTMTPAKYTWDPNAVPDCTKDFAVFPVNASGSSGQANLVGLNNLYSSQGASTPAPLCGTSGPSFIFAYNVGTGAIITAAVTSGHAGSNYAVGDIVTVLGSGTAGTLRVSSVSSGAVTGLTIVTVGDGYSATSGVATTDSGSGTGLQVTLTVTTGGGTVQTSAVLSLGGTKVAFVESRSGGSVANASVFHVLTKGTNTGHEGTSATSPVVPGSGTSPNNSTAVDIAIRMSGNVAVSISSPFIDYNSDVAYVGDDSGTLHKFTGVFNGNPAEAGSPWPVTVSTASSSSSGKILSGPIYDSGGSGNIFVGDGTGELFSVVASSGATTGLTTIGAHTSGCVPISDPPIVDSSAEMVYTQEGTTQGNNCTGQKQHGYVIQVNTSLSPIASIDLGASGLTVHSGAFDQAYFDAAGKGGYYYYCAGSTPSLRLATFTSGGVMTSDTHTLSLGASGDVCSPLTEVFNTTTANDWLFVGTTGGTVKNFAITGWEPSTSYALNYEITDSNLNVQKVTKAGTSGSTEPTWSTSGTTSDSGVTWTYQAALAATSSASETGGTSGIIVDNVAPVSTLSSWAANHAYSLNALVLDSNNNAERVTACAGTCTSGSSAPSWNNTVGGTTIDNPGANQITWTNQGPVAPQASSIYFGTLGTGSPCTSGQYCAVKLTQAGLL